MIELDLAIGVDVDSATAWREGRFDVEEAALWRSAPFDAEEAATWREGGFDASDAAEWAGSAPFFELSDPLVSQADGFGPEDSTHAYDAGFQLNESKLFVVFLTAESGLTDPVALTALIDHPDPRIRAAAGRNPKLPDHIKAGWVLGQDEK